MRLSEEADIRAFKGDSLGALLYRLASHFLETQAFQIAQKAGMDTRATATLGKSAAWLGLEAGRVSFAKDLMQEALRVANGTDTAIEIRDNMSQLAQRSNDPPDPPTQLDLLQALDLVYRSSNAETGNRILDGELVRLGSEGHQFLAAFTELRHRREPQETSKAEALSQLAERNAVLPGAGDSLRDHFRDM
ncbi:MAG: hypothetical protein MPN21_27015 [Thermoanaerobaculia bacterium]|nr:hypothetical protein [Thermoanaerobaculia bacterium]